MLPGSDRARQAESLPPYGRTVAQPDGRRGPGGAAAPPTVRVYPGLQDAPEPADRRSGRTTSDVNPLAYAPLPHALIEDPALEALDVRVAALILKRLQAAVTGRVYNEELARGCGVKERTILLALARLKVRWFRFGPDPGHKGRRLITAAWRDRPQDFPAEDASPRTPEPAEGAPGCALKPAEGWPRAHQDAPSAGLRAHPGAPNKEGGMKKSNVTSPARFATPPGGGNPAPPGTQAAPGHDKEPPARAIPLGPMTTEELLAALPGRDDLIEATACRIAEDIRDELGTPYYRKRCAEVAEGKAPLARLQAAFTAGVKAAKDLKYVRPGAAFNVAWKGWTARPTAAGAANGRVEPARPYPQAENFVTCPPSRRAFYRGNSDE